MRSKLPLGWTITAEIVILSLIALVIERVVVFLQMPHAPDIEPGTLFGLGVLVVLLLLMAAVFIILALPERCVPAPLPGEVPPGAISPLLFGTNLSQIKFDNKFATSRHVRHLFRQLHITFIRVDIPRSDTEFTAAEKKSMYYMKKMCTTPLIILHFPLHSNGEEAKIQENLAIIKQMNEIFRDRVVYYELGNEPDLHPGVNGKAYAAYWNKAIGSLKQCARNGKFGGPAFSRAKPQDMADFVQSADPKPDFISWHEYNVQRDDTVERAAQRLNDVIRNIAETRSATGSVAFPIIISEWNYESAIETLGHPDLRATPDFLKQYVGTTLTNLIANGVFAANQFQTLDSHPEYQLIDQSNKLSPAGEMFKQVYEQHFCPQETGRDGM